MKCVNGHDNAAGASYCALCGESVIAPAPIPATPGSWAKRHWGALTGAVLLVVALAGGTYAAIQSNNSGSTGGATAASDTTSDTASSAPATPGVETWLCSFTNAALLIQWPDNGGVVTGSYQQAILQGTPPNQRVTNGTGDVTGTDTNGTLAFKVDGVSWYGSISGNSMTLNIPQNDGTIQTNTCSPSSPGDWNYAVANLGGTVSSSNATAATQQQYASDAQALQAAINQLQRDTQSLNQSSVLGGDVNTAKADVANAQNDFNAEQKDDCSSMQGDASGVSGDESGLEGDQTGEQADAQGLHNSVSGLQQDITKVGGLSTVVMNEGGSSSTYPQGDINAANKVIAEINQSIAWANGQMTSLVNQAKSIASRAQSYASAHSC